MKHDKMNQSSNNEQKGNRIKQSMAALLVALGLTACSSGESQPIAPTAVTAEAAPQPDKSAEAQLDATEKEAAINLNKHAIAAANSILTIMGNPDAGVEYSSRYFVGNKGMYNGPDQVEGTADDIDWQTFPFPEVRAVYYPERKQLLIIAMDNDAEDKSDTENLAFTGVSMLFDVDSSNPITKETDQLTIDDFAQALTNTNSLKLAAMGVMDNYIIKHDLPADEQPGYTSGVWLSEAGLIFTDGALTAVDDAFGNEAPNPADALTDTDQIVNSVNHLTSILATATSRLSAN